MTGTMIPVADLLRANPAWIRSDMGNMRALTKDVAERGVVVPIVAAPDCLVFDGARRIMAAKQAKQELVPVTWCEDWLTAVTAMREGVSKPDAYPMTWAELNLLWSQLLKPLSDEHRYSSMGAVRRRNRRQQAAQAQFQEGAEGPYSRHTNDLAAIYGTTPAAVKVMRDGWTQLERMRKSAPEFYTKMHTAINELMRDTSNRDIDRARQIKYAVRRYLEHSPVVSVQEIIDVFVATASKPQTVSRHHAEVYRGKLSQVRREAEPTSLTVLNNFAVLLEQVAATADTFVNFNEDQQTVSVVAARILGSVRHIQSMRRRLENSVLLEKKEEDSASH